jgi:uridine phosphorylase
MPYLEASAADLQRSFAIADADLPDAAVILGSLRRAAYQEWLGTMWPQARQVDERITHVEIDGCRLWFVVTFGAAMAATFAHLAVRLGAGGIVQLGAIGGLQFGWQVGDVVIPTQVIGRDGVSRQLTRNRPLTPDPSLMAEIGTRLERSGLTIRSGTLVSTTTIAFERPRDIARWRRAGYVGVEMEAAATFAVAAHYGVKAAGAFVLLDNLAADHTVFSLTDDERVRVRAAREPMTRAAVSALTRAMA